MTNQERLADLKAKNQGLSCWICGKTVPPRLAEEDGEAYEAGALICPNCDTLLFTAEGQDAMPGEFDYI